MVIDFESLQSATDMREVQKYRISSSHVIVDTSNGGTFTFPFADHQLPQPGLCPKEAHLSRLKREKRKQDKIDQERAKQEAEDKAKVAFVSEDFWRFNGLTLTCLLYTSPSPRDS